MELPPVQAPPAILLKDDLGVCPQSLITIDAQTLLALQSHCSEYHTSPYSTTWVKNPNKIIEAFDAIKEGLNLQLRYSMKQSQEKSSGEGKKTLPIGLNRKARQ